MTITSFDTNLSTNTEIEITSVYFRNNDNEQRFESFPRRMVYEGREISFIENGMRYLVQKGQQLIKLFDVSDGETQYRLRLDGSDRWTLVNMREAQA
jgi:hypothetical protein